jgi:opacity protein-like surface antigen
MYMKKTATMCSILAACITTSAFAGDFYLGPTLLVQKISASHSSFSGAHPRFSVGYGGLLDNYYLAGELFAIPATATFSNKVNNGGISAKVTRSFGVSILPGLVLNRLLIGYLRFGVVTSKFTSPNTMKMGGQAGVGLQTGFNEHWDLRGEYIYTAYKSIAKLGTPKSYEIGIGVIYRWDSDSICHSCF